MISFEEASLLLNYNPETGVLTWKVNRGSKFKAGDIAGHTSTSGYIDVCVKGRLYGAHRLAWLLSYGEFPKFPEEELDHINRIRHDNRLSNLRKVSKSENNKNKINSVNKISKEKSISVPVKRRDLSITEIVELVSYDKDTGVFRNKITHSQIGFSSIEGYSRIGLKGKTYMSHRLAWIIHYGEYPMGL